MRRLPPYSPTFFAMAIAGPAVATSATGAQLALGPPGPPGKQGVQGPQGPQGPAGSPSQGTVALVNGLNSNVSVPGAQSSIRFGSYTGAVILGGFAPATSPIAGQAYDLSFIVSGQSAVIRNLDASSSSGNQVLTGTGYDVLLPIGSESQCRLVWDATVSKYRLQTTGIIQSPEVNPKNFGATGNGSTDDTAALQAVAALGPGYHIKFQPGTYLFSSNVTFPAGQTLRFLQGATLKASGAVCTINGQIEAPRVQIFEGTGTISSVTHVGSGQAMTAALAAFGPTGNHTIEVTMVSGGVVGTSFGDATFYTQVDSGVPYANNQPATYGPAPITVGQFAASTVALPSRGVILSFPAGTYDAADTFTFTTVAPFVIGDGGEGVFPEWWGAVADGSTDSTASIQAAGDVLAAAKTKVLKFGGGQYNCSSTIGPFNEGSILRGVGAYFPGEGYQTIIACFGVGVGIETGLTLEANGSLITIENMGIFGGGTVGALANSIIGVTSGPGGTCEIQTATNHNYSTGDLVNISGVQSPNLAANSDMSLPWPVVKVDATHFYLLGSTFGGAYAQLSGTISAVSTVQLGTGTTTLITTSSAHGLTNSSRVALSFTGGSLAFSTSGPYSVIVVSKTTFAIYPGVGPYAFNPVTHTGTFSAGTFASGGLCVNNSQCNLIGIDMCLNSAIVRDCFIGGFKYGLSFDAAENAFAERVWFEGALPGGLGYPDSVTNYGDFSSASARLGSFACSVTGAANGITLKECQFNGTFYGTMHHDGVGQWVSECNYEIPCGAWILAAQSVTIEKFIAEGALIGLVYCNNDNAVNVGDGDIFNLAVRDGFPSQIGCPVIWSQTGFLVGLVYANVQFGSPFAVYPPIHSVPGVNYTTASFGGNILPSGGTYAEAVCDAQTGSGTGTILNGGLAPTACLDVQTPGMPQPMLRLHVNNLASGYDAVFTEDAMIAGSQTPYSNPLGGCHTKAERIYSRNTTYIGSDGRSTRDWASLTATTSAAGMAPINCAGFFNFGNSYIGGIYKCTVVIKDFTANLTSTWSFRYSVSGASGGNPVLGTLLDFEVDDPVGLPDPTVGVTGANIVVAWAGSSTDACYVSVYASAELVGV